ncbi:MAG: hypothetical protein J6V53_03490 [Alphaproteobacteria bacterium]|nr:hypothetical protein [Alphaproteobacteria bacterium]
MDLSIQIMSITQTINETLNFQTDDSSSFWKDPLFQAYPSIDKRFGFYLPWSIRKEYLSYQLMKIYSEEKKTFKQQQKIYIKQWTQYREMLTDIFSEIFHIDCKNRFNEIQVDLSLNPICPRYIDEKRFSVFYKYGPKQFLNLAIHEIIHFIWFDVWQKHFKDNKQEYEQPHLKWLLSEMVIDTLIKYTKLNTLYAKEDIDKPAYAYFYDIHIQGKPILEKLKEIYQTTSSIQNFMEKAYLYLQENESEIQKQII